MTDRTPRPAIGRRSAARARGRGDARGVQRGIQLGVLLGVLLTTLLAASYTGQAQATGGSMFAEAADGPGIEQLPRVVLDAHRAGGLEARENSISGIRRALASGVVDVVDLDVRRLADGALGVMHDPTVDRVTTSSGPTSSYTRKQWQTLRLDIGAWLTPRPPPEAPPTLAEVLDRFGSQSVFTVEVKEGLVDEVARLLRSRGLTDSVFVNTNHPDVARLVHQMGLRSHLWRTAAQMRTDEPSRFAGFVDLLDLDVRADPADFRRAVASGVPRVWAHTITTRAERDRALRLGANGIVTDNPRYVAGLTDVYPASTTVIRVRRTPHQVQASDRTHARVQLSSQSGPVLRDAVVTVASHVVTGRTLRTSEGGVSRVRISAAGAERGRTEVAFVVRAGRAGERRWPGARVEVPLRVTGEDLQLVPSTRVTSRGLRVRVGLLDSAATGYDGPRAEQKRRTPADLRGAVLRLRVLRGDEVVHRDRLPGQDTGTTGDGIGAVAFPRWDDVRPGRYTVKVVQRGRVYATVVVERRIEVG